MTGIDTDVSIDLLNAATGNQEITFRSGFGTPKGAIFAIFRAQSLVGATPLGVEDNAAVGYGAADGTSEWTYGFSSEHNVGTSDVYNWGVTTHCVLVLDPTNGTVYTDASFVSFGTDKLTINVTSVGPSLERFYLWTMALTGDDLDFAVGTATTSATQDTATTVTLPTGFGTPTGFVCISGGSGFRWDNASAQSQARLTLGYASYDHSTIRQASGSVRWPDNQGTQRVAARVSTDYVIRNAIFAASPILDAAQPAADISAVAAGEFDITTRAVNAALQVGYIAIGNVPCFAGVWDWPTGTGVKNFDMPNNTDPPDDIYPRGVLMTNQAVNYSEIDTDITTLRAGTISMGAIGSDGSEACGGVQMQRNTSTSNTSSLFADEAVSMATHNGTMSIEGTHDNFDLDGHGINVSNNAGNNKAFPQLLIGVHRIAVTPRLDVGVNFGVVALAAGIAPARLDVPWEFGQPSLAAQLAPARLDVPWEFGQPSLAAQLQPDRLDVPWEFGQPSLVAVLQPDRFDVSVAFGQPSLSLTYVLEPSRLLVRVVFGVPTLVDLTATEPPARSPAGNAVLSGPVDGFLTLAGPTIGAIVQSGPVVGQALQSGPVAGAAAQSGTVAGSSVQSGPVTGQQVHSA